MSHWSLGWGKQRPCSYWLAQCQGQDEADNSDTDLCCLDLGLKPETCPLILIMWPLASRGPHMWPVRCEVGLSSTNCLSQWNIFRELKKGRVKINIKVSLECYFTWEVWPQPESWETEHEEGKREEVRMFSTLLRNSCKVTSSSVVLIC